MELPARCGLRVGQLGRRGRGAAIHDSHPSGPEETTEMRPGKGRAQESTAHRAPSLGLSHVLMEWGFWR